MKYGDRQSGTASPKWHAGYPSITIREYLSQRLGCNGSGLLREKPIHQSDGIHSLEDDSDWADNYIGTWVGEPSRVLKIHRVGPKKYLATLTIDGKPVLRPWMNGAPTIDMPAEYTFDVHDGADFCIDLWSQETHLVLHLDFRSDYLLHSRVIDRLSVILGSEEYMPHDSDFYLDAIGGLGDFFRQSHSPEDQPSSE